MKLKRKKERLDQRMAFVALVLACAATLIPSAEGWGPGGSSPYPSGGCCMICPERFYDEAAQFLELDSHVKGGAKPAKTDSQQAALALRHRTIMRRFEAFYKHHTGEVLDASFMEIGALAERRQRMKQRQQQQQRMAAGTGAGTGGFRYIMGNARCCKVCPDLFEKPGWFDVALVELAAQGLISSSSSSSHGTTSTATSRRRHRRQTNREFINVGTGKQCPSRKCCPVCPRQLYPPRDIIDTHNFLEAGEQEGRRSGGRGGSSSSSSSSSSSEERRRRGRGRSDTTGTDDEAAFFASRFRSVNARVQQHEADGQQPPGAAAAAAAAAAGASSSSSGRHNSAVGFEEGVTHPMGRRLTVREASNKSPQAAGEEEEDSSQLRFAERQQQQQQEQQQERTSPPPEASQCCVACIEKMWGQHGSDYGETPPRQYKQKDLYSLTKNPANKRSYSDKPPVDDKW